MRSNARLSRCGVFHSVSFLPGMSSKLAGFSPEFASKTRERSRHGRVKPRGGHLFDEIDFFSYVGTHGVSIFLRVVDQSKPCSGASTSPPKSPNTHIAPSPRVWTRAASVSLLH